MNKGILVRLFTKERPRPAPAVPAEAPAQNWCAPVASIEEAIKNKRVTSRLAQGAVNVGDLNLDGGLQVQGTHDGKLIVTHERGVVWISETGAVNGDIDAPQVYIHGMVVGSIRADLVILEGNGQVIGQISANRVLLRNMNQMKVDATFMPRERVVVPQTEPAAVVPIAAVG